MYVYTGNPIYSCDIIFITLTLGSTWGLGNRNDITLILVYLNNMQHNDIVNIESGYHTQSNVWFL